MGPKAVPPTDGEAARGIIQTHELPDDGSWELGPISADDPYPGELDIRRGPHNNDEISAACVALFVELSADTERNYMGTTELAACLGVHKSSVIRAISKLGMSPRVGRVVTRRGTSDGYLLTREQALLVTKILAGQRRKGELIVATPAADQR